MNDDPQQANPQKQVVPPPPQDPPEPVPTVNSSQIPVEPMPPAQASQPTMPTPPSNSSEPPLSQPVTSDANNEKKESRGIVSFIVTIVIALLLTQIINLFFFQSYRVFGNSMYPTLHDGDRLIISKIGKTTSNVTKKTYQPSRGEIIVFTSPKEPDLQLIKRVIGLPGERVVVREGEITVYNAEQPQGFNPDSDTEYGASLPKTSGQADITVPEGHVFVSGDNREGSNSLDSRNELGTVPEELIVGTNAVRVWPLQDAKFF